MILRSYIAEARNERREPEDVTEALASAEPVLDTVCWDETTEIAKIVYKALGHTAREQFDLGIVEQPRRIANLIICSKLRRVYGDLSAVAGFDAKGNLKLERYNDILRAVFSGRHIVRLEGLSSRQLAKQYQG